MAVGATGDTASELLHDFVGKLAEREFNAGHLSQEDIDTYWRDITKLQVERDERVGSVLQFIQEDLDMHGPLEGKEADDYFRSLNSTELPAHERLAKTLSGMYRLGAAMVSEDKQTDLAACWEALSENLNEMLQQSEGVAFSESIEKLHDILSENK